MIRITAEGNNASGKTTVLSLIHAMLKEKGFTNVEVMNVEELPDTFEAKGEEAIKRPGLTDTLVVLQEKHGTISR